MRKQMHSIIMPIPSGIFKAQQNRWLVRQIHLLISILMSIISKDFIWFQTWPNISGQKIFSSDLSSDQFMGTLDKFIIIRPLSIQRVFGCLRQDFLMKDSILLPSIMARSSNCFPINLKSKFSVFNSCSTSNNIWDMI